MSSFHYRERTRLPHSLRDINPFSPRYRENVWHIRDTLAVPAASSLEYHQLKLSISDKGSWHCLINLSFMRTISRYNNNEIPLTSSSSSLTNHASAMRGQRFAKVLTSSSTAVLMPRRRGQTTTDELVTALATIHRA
jgi:hypothetical protein